MSIEVPLERIRIQTVREKPSEMWGFVWVNHLPFCFRAWPSSLHKNTEWGFVHAPYQPLSFTAPIFTEGIAEDDMTYMLSMLRVTDERIELAREDGKIPELFRATLRRRKRAYRKFRELYTENAELRGEYGTAVRNACDQRETKLHIPS